MSEGCTRQGSYADRSRLRFSKMIDRHTAYDADENVERCRQCGGQTVQCPTCWGRVHLKEPECPHCGIDMRAKWRVGTNGSRVA